jgi:hypothetical protein
MRRYDPTEAAHRHAKMELERWPPRSAREMAQRWVVEYDQGKINPDSKGKMMAAMEFLNARTV